MITYSDARSPVYANAEETIVNLEVNFDHMPEDYVLFTASPNDTEAHAVDILAKALAGDFGVVGPYVAP